MDNCAQKKCLSKFELNHIKRMKAIKTEQIVWLQVQLIEKFHLNKRQLTIMQLRVAQLSIMQLSIMQLTIMQLTQNNFKHFKMAIL